MGGGRERYASAEVPPLPFEGMFCDTRERGGKRGGSTPGVAALSLSLPLSPCLSLVGDAINVIISIDCFEARPKPGEPRLRSHADCARIKGVRIFRNNQIAVTSRFFCGRGKKIPRVSGWRNRRNCQMQDTDVLQYTLN